jgi:hypothetical protein
MRNPFVSVCVGIGRTARHTRPLLLGQHPVSIGVVLCGALGGIPHMRGVSLSIEEDV